MVKIVNDNIASFTNAMGDNTLQDRVAEYVLLHGSMPIDLAKQAGMQNVPKKLVISPKNKLKQGIKEDAKKKLKQEEERQRQLDQLAAASGQNEPAAESSGKVKNGKKKQEIVSPQKRRKRVVAEERSTNKKEENERLRKLNQASSSNQ